MMPRRRVPLAARRWPLAVGADLHALHSTGVAKPVVYGKLEGTVDRNAGEWPVVVRGNGAHMPDLARSETLLHNLRFRRRRIHSGSAGHGGDTQRTRVSALVTDARRRGSQAHLNLHFHWRRIAKPALPLMRDTRSLDRCDKSLQRRSRRTTP